MKKQIFYMFNIFICSIFLAIRYAGFAFGVDYLTYEANNLNHVITISLLVVVGVNFYLIYKEFKKSK